MSSYNKISYLVANTDYPIKAAGVAIDVCPSGDCGDECRYNAVPGEILIIDLATRLTIDAGDIATTNKVAIAQAIGRNGCATDLKFLFGDNFDLCKHNFDLNTASPNCGQQQILDVYFPTCTAIDTTFGFGVWLDDSYVRSTNGYNNKLLYSWAVDNHKAGCTDCDEVAVCEELVCKLVDKINGSTQPDPTKVIHGLKANLCQHYQPFRAARVYMGTGTTKKFCLTVSDGAVGCSECAYLPAITGITINAVSTPFAYTVDPSDPTRSLKSQINRIVSLINKALKPIGGHAFLTKGLGNCCDYGIEINTCATTVTLNTIVNALPVAMAPCAVENNNPTQAAEVICRDCGATPAPIAVTCAIRLFVDQMEVPCNCAYPPNLPPPNTYIRTLQPGLLGDGLGSNSITVVTKQEPEYPEGFGYYYQNAARYQSNGGHGGDWRYTNTNRGFVGLPDEGSRDSNNEVLCEETYCVYDFEVHYNANGFHNNALNFNQKSKAVVLIRSKNTVLIPQWEAILLALKTRGVCSSINYICTP